MTTMTMTTMPVGTDAAHRLASHYTKIRARLYDPINMPPKNRLRTVLGEAAARQADARARAKAEADRLIAIRLAERRAEYRARKRGVTDKSRASIEARARIEEGNFEQYLAGCPFTVRKNPVLREAVRIILKHFRVTWLEIASGRKKTHILAARTVLFTLLRDLGFSYYGISTLTGRDGDAGSNQIRVLIKKKELETRANVCFMCASTCVENIPPYELAVWNVHPSNERN